MFSVLLISTFILANTLLYITDSDYTCKVRAATKISKGCEITTTYTLTLNGTMFRRKHLLDSKYFLCTCRRCSDPTELGTHFSTLLCQQCKKGHITVVEPLKDTVSYFIKILIARDYLKLAIH